MFINNCFYFVMGAFFGVFFVGFVVFIQDVIHNALSKRPMVSWDDFPFLHHEEWESVKRILKQKGITIYVKED